ncbi:uncharacterized protein LOC117294958 [Asterias rubens]|uniref:uncharacterized protein LOC117294958 n=1 Tax=Asterias rubens TaxID=7604 RepID=UPI001455CE69|nr:uncharacterized protein LOC117294958 [Asterias rubens]
MGRWLNLGVHFGTLITLLFATTILQTTEAQTQVSFEFRQNYSLIAQNVDNFESFLLADIIDLFNFSQTEVFLLQVTETTSGRIKVNFTLRINTASNAKIKSRNEMEQSLRTDNYAFVFMENVYKVQSTTVSIVRSISDIWHEYMPEIIIAVLCGMMALAIFTVSIQLLCMNRGEKKVRDVEVPLTNLPRGSATSLCRDNAGFFSEETNNGLRPHTPKSSIASSRYAHTQDRDTLYNKLIHDNYAVPAKHMFNFL